MLPAQYASIVVIVISLAVEFLWAINNRRKFLLAGPTIIWLIHSLAFYLTWWIVHPNLRPDWIIDWGAAVRLHGYLTLLIMGLYRFQKDIKWMR